MKKLFVTFMLLGSAAQLSAFLEARFDLEGQFEKAKEELQATKETRDEHLKVDPEYGRRAGAQYSKSGYFVPSQKGLPEDLREDINKLLNGTSCVFNEDQGQITDALCKKALEKHLPGIEITEIDESTYTNIKPVKKY